MAKQGARRPRPPDGRIDDGRSAFFPPYGAFLRLMPADGTAAATGEWGFGTFRAGSSAMTLHHFPVPVLRLGTARAGARAPRSEFQALKSRGQRDGLG